jgi:hypothetical protein
VIQGNRRRERFNFVVFLGVGHNVRPRNDFLGLPKPWDIKALIVRWTCLIDKKKNLTPAFVKIVHQEETDIGDRYKVYIDAREDWQSGGVPRNGNREI